MTSDHLIEQGNLLRENTQPWEALECYAQAFLQDPDNPRAWNNYGNVLRELGQPRRALPFLEHAQVLDPQDTTAPLNRAVALLLAGDWERGWPAYESRWNFEHMANTLPQLDRPRWQGEITPGHHLLLIAEQGLGDTIQFSRYALALSQAGMDVSLVVPDSLQRLLTDDRALRHTLTPDQELPSTDSWQMLMSLPGQLGVTCHGMHSPNHYIQALPSERDRWRGLLGARTRMRVGITWSGRRDTWINRHKSVPCSEIQRLIKRFPQVQWVNLQRDITPEEREQLEPSGLLVLPVTEDMAATAGVVANLDVVVGVDSAVCHLAAALGRPTWVMLNQYAQDWRWLLANTATPWYPTMRLSRQPHLGEWAAVTDEISRWLDQVKI